MKFNIKRLQICRILIPIVFILLIVAVIYNVNMKGEKVELKNINDGFILVGEGLIVSGKNICVKTTEKQEEYDVLAGTQLFKTSENIYVKTSDPSDILIIHKP